LLSKPKKIRNLLIGIHFNQTDPELLRRLSKHEGARIAANIGNGTFHPKIYYFQSGDKAAAIVGSANFTKAGTTNNIEAALLLEGGTGDAHMLGIRQTVESLWARGCSIDDDFLISYSQSYEVTRRHREALTKPLRTTRPKVNAMHPDLMTKSWRGYVSLIRSSPHHNLGDRLPLLRKARTLFDGVDSFSELTQDQRKAIAGVIGKRETFGTELDDHDWGWFGSMFGVGTFRNRLLENDHHLSAALDCIPPTGEVTHDDYWTFIDEFNLAFTGSARKGGVSPASMLLAMKWPDYFVCVNKKNRKRMSDDFGFAPTTLNFEKYWTEIIEPITQAKWWQARRRAGTEGRIWDGRAAMLDAIYYEPDAS
jgi:hypothetical protein